MNANRDNGGRSTRFLPLIVLSALTPLMIIALGLMIFVVPKWEKIFDDQNTPLSPAMLFLMNCSKWIGGHLRGQEIPGVLYFMVGLMISFGFAIFWAVRSEPLKQTV